MDKETFINICDHLKRHENLQDRWLVIVEEAVAMSLIRVGHNVRVRVVTNRFQHSQRLSLDTLKKLDMHYID